MSAKVLIVDDVPFMRLMQRDILNRGGFEVAGEAMDGEVAVRMYKELHPDVVLLDINMPKMNGVEALKEIMEYDQTALCIICSDVTQQEMLREALCSGARDFISKPFTMDKMVSVIQKQLMYKRGEIKSSS